MTIVSVQAEKQIARPIEVVRAQFSDMRHHMETRVHADLMFSNLRDDGAVCRLTSQRRLLGKLQTDEVELQRRADGSVLLRIVSGANEGLEIRQTFEALGADKTLVRTVVDAPVRGMLRLLTPLIRLALRRDTENALEEDRRDLEEKGYTPRTATSAV